MDTFAIKVLRILQEHINEKYGGNVKAAQVGLGFEPDKAIFYRWLNVLGGDSKQARMPRLDSIGAIMDKLGVLALTPAERADLHLPIREAAPAAPAVEESARVRELEAQVAELIQYKYKWEAALELSGKKIEAPQKKGNIA